MKAIDKAIRICDVAVSINESDYISSHGGRPRGYGHWIFGIGSKDMSKWYTVIGEYSKAKEIAKNKASKNNVSIIYTMG